MTATNNITRVPADFSNPDLFNPAYIPLLYDYTEFLHLFGSAGSGKSVFACQKEIIESYEPSRRGRSTLVIRKVGTTLKDSVYSELKSVISDWGHSDHFDILKSPLQITNKITGVSFIFTGLDDVEKVKSVANVDRILIEEATELQTFDELIQLRLRIRGYSRVQVTLCYNPINIHHWLNTEIHEMLPPGHRIFHTTYRDNVKMLAVDPGYAEYIEGLKYTKPNFYKVYGLGQWGQNTAGLIYPDYQVVPEMPPPSGYGLDFGFNDPCALIEGRIIDYPGETKRRLYLKERLFKTHLNAANLVSELDALHLDKNLPMIADNARPEMISSLREAGYFIAPVEKGNQSVLARINAMQEMSIRIVAGSKNMLKEISNYSWINREGHWIDQAQDGADHTMDAAGYFVRASMRLARVEDLSPAQLRESTVPADLRFSAIEARAPHQSVEQTEREIASHDMWANLAEVIKRKREEQDEELSEGYWAL